MKKRNAGILLCSAMSLIAIDARADQHDTAMQLKQSGKIIGLELIMQSVLERHPEARILEVELEKKRDQYKYEIELVTSSGVVRELEFDAHSGRLLSDEEDD